MRYNRDKFDLAHFLDSVEFPGNIIVDEVSNRIEILKDGLTDEEFNTLTQYTREYVTR